jgi:hypothetical protein
VFVFMGRDYHKRGQISIFCEFIFLPLPQRCTPSAPPQVVLSHRVQTFGYEPQDGKLRLSNGKGNPPLILDWRWDLPQTVVIHWTETEYEAIATYKQEQTATQPQGEKVAGIDLGEVHMAVAHDGTNQ